MADVELVLHVDNTDALAKIKQTQLAAAEMQKELSGKGDDRVKLLQKEVDELTKLGEAQKKAFPTDKMDDYNRTVGEGTEVLEEYGEETEVAEKKTTSMAGTAAKAAVVVAALKLAYEGLLKILTATGEGADKFKVAVAGLKGGLDQLFRSIATGNMRELGKQMKSAADEARRYQRVLFEIADLDRRLRVEESRVGIELEKNRRIIDSEVASHEEKKVALRAIIDLETKLNAFRKDNAIKTYDNIVQKLVQMTGQEEALVKAYISGDETLLDKIAIGRNYNKLLEDEKELTSGRADDAYKTGEAIKKHGEEVRILKERIANATEEEKKAAELATAFGIPTRELWVEATESMIDVQEALNAQMPISESAAAALNTTLEIQKDKIVSVSDAYRDVYNYAKQYADLLKKENDEFAKGLVDEAFKIPIEATGTGFQLTPEMVKEGEKQAKEQYDKTIDKDQKLANNQVAIQEAKFAAIEELTAGAFNVIYNNTEANYRKELDALDVTTQKQLKLVGDNEKAREMIILRSEQRKLAIEKEYAKKSQNIAVAQAVIQAALATVKIWQKYSEIPGAGPFLSAAETAVVAAVMLAEIATIKSQRLAKGASGDEKGIIKGKRHSEGGERFLNHVEVEAGEAWGVLSRPATSKFGKEFHEIVSSFNRGEMPEIPSMSNSVFVNNDGSNSRLDKLIAEQRKLNEKYGREAQLMVSGSKKIIRRGNKIRIIG